MTQHIRDLLDDAVAGVQPGSRDPVASVMGRHRAARRRQAVIAAAAAFVAVAVVGGGLAATRSMVNQPVPPVGTVTERAPQPKVVDGAVVAGAMRLPIPAGWQAVTAGAGDPCGIPAGTIRIYDKAPEGCSSAPITVTAPEHARYPVGSLDSVPGGNGVLTPPPLLTLPGGEPALMRNAFDENYNSLVLPWSKVTIEFTTDAATTVRSLAGTITTEPSGDGRLNLPDIMESAALSWPDASGQFTLANHAKITDAATMAKVTALLRDQKDVVTGADACTGPGGRHALLLAGTSVVFFTIGGDCQEAFSDKGGRVRLSDDTVRELTRLFGIEVR